MLQTDCYSSSSQGGESSGQSFADLKKKERLEAPKSQQLSTFRAFPREFANGSFLSMGNLVNECRAMVQNARAVSKRGSSSILAQI